MKGKIYVIIASIQVAILMFCANVRAVILWEAPFDTSYTVPESATSTLSLNDALNLVAAENPSFKSFDYQIQAAHENLDQAGSWSNPEFDIEIEEFGWDSPGFGESELSISLAQELEIFGQRGARKKVARAQMDATVMHVRVSAFDLYIKTKKRFYALAHTQQMVILNQKSVELTKDIVENINYRLDKGAALKSELLLARLEEQQALLMLDQSKQDVLAFETALVSLWKAKPYDIKVAYESEDDLGIIIDKIAYMSIAADSSRDVIQLYSELHLLNAERNMAIAESRPAITLSGGLKRYEFNDSRSFLLGLSLPIPIFNRNQGTRKSIDAQLQTKRYEIERERTEIQSSIESLIIQLKKSRETHAKLDTLLLPTAQDAYQNLRSAYNVGRIPYTQLLEAERILNDLSFEHNDIILEIHRQIIEFESLTGVVLFIQKEN